MNYINVLGILGKISLTDDMIVNAVNNEQSISVLLFIVSFCSMGFILLFIAIGLGIQGAKCQEETKKKRLKKNVIGLIIACCIFFGLSVVVYVNRDAANLQSDNWHVEKAQIAGKRKHYNRKSKNTKYVITFSGDFQSYQSGTGYDLVEEGDDVYVVVRNNRSTYVCYFYNMDDYEYMGSHFVEK